MQSEEKDGPFQLAMLILSSLNFGVAYFSPLTIGEFSYWISILGHLISSYLRWNDSESTCLKNYQGGTNEIIKHPGSGGLNWSPIFRVLKRSDQKKLLFFFYRLDILVKFNPILVLSMTPSAS